ncbi:hypothetical protein [Moraxella lacunata]
MGCKFGRSWLAYFYKNMKINWDILPYFKVKSDDKNQGVGVGLSP